MGSVLMKMTPQQRTIARHALGFDKGHGNKRSYRNHFSASFGSPNWWRWMQMTRKGLADHEEGESDLYSLHWQRMDIFWLTRQGAEMALNRGEGLDKEDFPL